MNKISQNINYKANLKSTRHGNLVIEKMLVDAKSYYDRNKKEQANYLYQQVLSLDPENILALNALGVIAMQMGMLSLATELFTAACDIDPHHLVVNKNLALVYTHASQYAEAMMQYIGILSIDENNSNAHSELARLNMKVGNLDIALSHYLRAFELNPENPENLHGVIKLDASSVTVNDVNKIEALLEDAELPLYLRSRHYFLLGKIYNHSEEFDKAFANYYVANLSKGGTFSSREHSAYVNGIINDYQSELVNEFKVAELHGSTQPIFLIGMPCSGSSLVEEVLSSSFEVCTVANSKVMQNIAGKQDVDAVHNIAQITLNKYANYYLNEVNNLVSLHEHITPVNIVDSGAENYLHLGLISLLFPRAYIIHCVRDTVDTCLTNYFTDFSEGHEYSYDQNNIAEYYRDYKRLMSHWKNVLPTKIHTVKYEDLVSKPEDTSKDLFNFVNLDWQADSIDFSKVSNKSRNLTDIKNSQYKASLNISRKYNAYTHLLKSKLKEVGCLSEMSESVIGSK